MTRAPTRPPQDGALTTAPTTSPTLREPAHVALGAALDEGELRSAVRAGANEAPDAARPLAEGAVRGHHPGARRHRRGFQQVFVHYESTRAASSTNQSINAI